MTDRKVGKYSLVSHGLDSSSYFQGAGTAYTDWDDCYTGVGESEREAIEDALENIASSEWDISAIEVNDAEWSNKDDAHKGCTEEFAREFPQYIDPETDDLVASVDDGDVYEEAVAEWEQWHESCEVHYFATVYVQEAYSDANEDEYCDEECDSESGCIFGGRYTEESGLSRQDFIRCGYRASSDGQSCHLMVIPGDKCPAGHNS